MLVNVVVASLSSRTEVDGLSLQVYIDDSSDLSSKVSVDELHKVGELFGIGGCQDEVHFGLISRLEWEGGAPTS